MRTAALVSILAACLVGPAASAAIVHFSNPAPGEPGHYNWRCVQAEGWESWLDITAPSTAQGNLVSGSSIGQLYTGDVNRTLGGALVNRVFFNSWGIFATETHSAGDLIGFGGGIFFSTLSIHMLEIEPGSVVSAFPEGERSFIGVRTVVGNYGWIEVERHGVGFAAYSWAYETEPGVPILAGQIPTPGALVVLGLGAFATTRRRRP